MANADIIDVYGNIIICNISKYSFSLNTEENCLLLAPYPTESICPRVADAFAHYEPPSAEPPTLEPPAPLLEPSTPRQAPQHNWKNCTIEHVEICGKKINTTNFTKILCHAYLQLPEIDCDESIIPLKKGKIDKYRYIPEHDISFKHVPKNRIVRELARISGKYRISITMRGKLENGSPYLITYPMMT